MSARQRHGTPGTLAAYPTLPLAPCRSLKQTNDLPPQTYEPEVLPPD
jgi:hypothetical protein